MVYMIMRKIILASMSPRRKEILAKTRLPFDVVASDYEENMSLALPPSKLAEHLSKGKAEAVAAQYPDAIIIAADTFIVFENQLIGKPRNAAHAIEILQMLRGKAHQVITGVTILDTASGNEKSFHDTANVYMKNITDETIRAYVATGEPLDKAGAYALQELGAVLIEKIEGDFFNVMGLPLSRLSDELQLFGVNVCQ